MPDLSFIRVDIERMRVQIGRQRKEIIQLHRAGIGTASVEALLARMQTKVDNLCAQRDEMKKAAPPEPGSEFWAAGNGRPFRLAGSSRAYTVKK